MATHLLQVVQDPLHFLYEKVCTFLCSRPLWARPLSYWVKDIILGPPTEIESYWLERGWLVDLAYNALRTPSEVTAYQRSGLLEHLLMSLSQPRIPEAIWLKTMKIFWRCTYVDGGPDLLISKCGITHSLKALCRTQPIHAKHCKALARRILDTCDQERADKFSFGTIKDAISSM